MVSAAVAVLLTSIGVFIIALVVDALAPSFGGTKNQVQALKVVAYAYTASWVGGILSLVPALSVVGILFGLYSLYLLYLGLPRAHEVTAGQSGWLHGRRDRSAAS